MNHTLKVIKEPLIHNGKQVIRFSDIELQKLGKTSFTQNKNHIAVLNKILEHFETDDLFVCMMLAFNYGEMVGRRCERDLIKHNALATFQWMKVYYKENGCFPKTQKELWDWEKEFVNELETKEGVHSENNH